MSTAWLFLGDLATRASEFRCQLEPGDCVLLAPPQPMFKPAVDCPGFPNAEVDVLGRELLSPAELDLALQKVEESIRILRETGGELSPILRPWWLFRSTYFVTAVRENALGSVALEKWLSRRRPEQVVIVREHRKLVSVDFADPGGSGPDNVLGFVAERICAERGIACRILRRPSLKQSLRRFWSDLVRPRAISAFRTLLLVYQTLRQRVKSGEGRLEKGGVLYFTRSSTHTRLFLNLIETLPGDLTQSLLYQVPASLGIRELGTDLPKQRLERFCRVGEILGAVVGGGLRRSLPNCPVGADPIVDGFLARYLDHARIHGAILGPYFAGLTRALGAIRPSLLIASDEPGPFNQLIFEAASALNIPAVSVQHGELSAVEAVGMHQPMAGDFHLVRPGGTRPFFLSRGMQASEIAVYAFDSFGSFGRSRDPGEDAGEAATIFVAGTALGIASFLPVLRDFVAKVTGLVPGARIIFRPHPSEPVQAYAQVIELERLPVVVVSGKEPLASQISEARCAVVFSSSLALDLVLHGVPTVICNFSRWPLLGYRHDAFTITYTIDDTVIATSRMLSDGALRRRCLRNREDFLAEIEQARRAPDSNEWWDFFRGLSAKRKKLPGPVSAGAPAD